MRTFTSRRTTSLLVKFLSAQTAAQIFALVAGILIVRAVGKPEYAQYAVMTSLIAGMTLLSESGVTSGLMQVGATQLGDAERLSVLFSSGLTFRRNIALFVLAFGGVFLAVLLHQNGAAPAHIAIYILLVSLSFWPVLTKGILHPYLRLTKRYQFIQVASLVSNCFRLALVAALYFGGAASVTALLLVGLFSAILETRLLRRTIRDEVVLSPDRHDRQHDSMFRANLRKTLPMNFVLITQTQLFFFLVGWRGSTAVVAEIAAVSRLSLVFAVLLSVVGDVGAGSVARAGQQPRAVVACMARFLGGFAAASACVVIVVAIFASQLLHVLGRGYGGIEEALIIVAAGAAAINLTDGFRSLNQARGWLAGSWTYLPGTVAWVAVGLTILDLRDPTQAAWFLALQAAPALIAQSVCFGTGMRQLRKEANSSA